jgi:lipoprotein-anchoring transpeptidase ErfK/SrfK
VNGQHEAKKYALNKDILTSRHRTSGQNVGLDGGRAETEAFSMQSRGQAIRYGVGVGGEGFGWSGSATVHSKQEWPDWYPPAEMLQRKPELREHMTQLQSGIGMQGGPENPIGARGLYLWQGNKDTLYRIHGTNEPWTIGQNVSSGCIRLTNDDIVDLYNRTPIGTKVVVLATATSSGPAAPAGSRPLAASQYDASVTSGIVASQQR